MKKSILKCDKCCMYTIKESCPICNKKTINPKPPRFSPEDRYGDYRRKAKAELLAKEGLL